MEIMRRRMANATQTMKDVLIVMMYQMMEMIIA
jgi:hypothetical protein